MSIYETAVLETYDFQDGCLFGKSDNLHMCIIGLLGEDHFLQQVVGSGKLVDCEQDVADVERNVAAIVRVEDDVAHRSFPYAVEIQADQVAVLVDNRTSRIAS